MKARMPDSAMIRFVTVWLFPLALAGMGAVFVAVGAWQAARASASSSWPSAPGVVLASAVESRSGQKGGHTYGAGVRYSYEVEGRPYTGTRISFGDYSSSDRSRAQGVADRYPAGSRIAVRYLPTDPSVSVLEPGAGGAVWVFPAAGGLAVLLGAGMAVFLRRVIKR